MNNSISGLRIATAILTSSIAFFAAPSFAATGIDAAEDTGRLHLSQRFSHHYLGDIDLTHASYIEAMEDKLGLWE